MTCLRNGYSLDFIDSRIQHFYTHFDAISLRRVLDQHVYKKLRHRLFNFISEQHRYLDDKKESKKKNQYARLTYLYEFGPIRQFNEKLHEILRECLNASNKTSDNFKIKLNIRTKYQHSLNALLSQQKPNHPLIHNEKKNFQ